MIDIAPDRVIERIKSRIEISANGCWLWTGPTVVGYGRVNWKTDDGRMVWTGAHRVMYTTSKGPIPEGMDIDHLCHEPKDCHPANAADCPHRKCCNPDHLDAVSRRNNLLRGGTVAASRRAITHCPEGHGYILENTLVDTLGRRSCKECVYKRNRAYYWANRERRKAYNKAWHAKRKEISI